MEESDIIPQSKFEQLKKCLVVNTIQPPSLFVDGTDEFIGIDDEPEQSDTFCPLVEGEMISMRQWQINKSNLCVDKIRPPDMVFDYGFEEHVQLMQEYHDMLEQHRREVRDYNLQRLSRERQRLEEQRNLHALPKDSYPHENTDKPTLVKATQQKQQPQQVDKSQQLQNAKVSQQQQQNQQKQKQQKQNQQQQQKQQEQPNQKQHQKQPKQKQQQKTQQQKQQQQQLESLQQSQKSQHSQQKREQQNHNSQPQLQQQLSKQNQQLLRQTHEEETSQPQQQEPQSLQQLQQVQSSNQPKWTPTKRQKKWKVRERKQKQKQKLAKQNSHHTRNQQKKRNEKAQSEQDASAAHLHHANDITSNSIKQGASSSTLSFQEEIEALWTEYEACEREHQLLRKNIAEYEMFQRNFIEPHEQYFRKQGLLAQYI